jgi:hypothetical protein
VRTTKPPESIGVPTRRDAEALLHHNQGCGHGTRAPGAPFGPRLFPSERRSRYGTRVYANLCPLSSVDTSTSADKLEKGKKGLKTNEFRAFLAELVRSDSSSRADSARRSLGQRGGNARKRATRWRKAADAARASFDRSTAVGWLEAAFQPATGGSVTIASAWISTSLRRLPGAVVARCDQAVPRCLTAAVDDVQVSDLGIFFGRMPSRHPLRAERLLVVECHLADDWMSRRDRSTRDIRAVSEGRQVRPDSVPAQPLHRLSAVARFDSSSPHGIAVRGNQEKMR